MKLLQEIFIRRPLLSTIVTVLVCISPLFFFRLIWGADESFRIMIQAIFRYIASFFLLIMLVRFGWGNVAAVTVPVMQWGKRWWLAMVPMLLLGMMNLEGVNWGSANFNFINLTTWLISNSGTGLFEEILMRGVCFYTLYRSWGNTRTGVFKASIIQALIFGLIHFLNLIHSPPVDVFFQVIYAILLGIGFAGLVVYTRSLWTAVFIHTIINAAGNINRFLIPDFVDSSGGSGGTLLGFIIVFAISTLPGLWYLKNAQLRLD